MMRAQGRVGGEALSFVVLLSAISPIGAGAGGVTALWQPWCLLTSPADSIPSRPQSLLLRLSGGLDDAAGDSVFGGEEGSAYPLPDPDADFREERVQDRGGGAIWGGDGSARAPREDEGGSRRLQLPEEDAEQHGETFGPGPAHGAPDTPEARFGPAARGLVPAARSRHTARA